MRNIEIKYFANNQDNGLDADSAPFSVAKNSVVNMENCRWGSTDKGVINTIESIVSTLLLSDPQPSISLAFHGGCEDVENERIIYCLRDIYSVNHKIMCYDYRNGIVYTVLLSGQITGGLNFNKNYFIHSCRVANGLFYFTDNYNQPRRINIDAGIKLNQPSYNTSVAAYTSPIDDTVITIIRKPPNYPLSFTKMLAASVGITLNNNQIKNGAFLFTYFYTYRDNEVSTNSMWSSLAPYNYPTDTYDIIRLRVPFAEIIQQDVQKITLGVVYADTKNSRAFEIKTWDKANETDLAEINAHNAGSTQLTYYFANNEVGNAIINLTKPYDSVPLLCKTLTIADQRSMLANNRMGFNTPLVSSLTASTITSSSSITALKTGSARRLAVVFFDKYMRQCGVVPLAKLITVADKSFTYPTTYEYAIQWVLSNTNAINEIPDWAYYYTVASTKDISRSSFVQAYAGDIFYASKSADGVYSFDKTVYSTDNIGVAIRLNVLSGQGMGYLFNENDLVNLRVSTGGVVTSVTLGVKEQQGNYLILENSNLGTLSFNSIAIFEIYTPNNQAASNFYYEQGSIYAISAPTTEGRQYGTLTGTIAGDIYLLDRNSLNKITYNLPTGYIVSETLFTLGCTFVSQLASSSNYSTGSSPLQTTSGWNPLTDNSRWIAKTIAQPVTFNIRGTLVYQSTNDNHFNSFLSYNDGASSTDIGIIADHQTDSGIVYRKDINIDVTVPAGNRLYIFGNSGGHSQQFFLSSLVITTMTDGALTKFECMSPNDKYWQNWFTNAGRIQLVDRIGQQDIKTSVKWSNTFIEGTRTNGLSSFDADDQKLLPLECGEINKLQITSKVENELGIVMLAICEKQTVSLYLGEVQQYGSNKATNLTLSDTVIGSVNILKGNYGTINPESVIEYRGNVYWLDAINGRFVQYSVNGLFPISNFKMTRFWKQWCLQYMSMTNSEIEALGFSPYVFTAVDPSHNELLISLPKLSNTPPKGYLPDTGLVSETKTAYDVRVEYTTADFPLPAHIHYYGKYYYIDDVPQFGYYVLNGSEATDSIPPPTIPTSATIDFSQLTFKGTTLNDVINSILTVGATVNSSSSIINSSSIVNNIIVYTIYPFDILDFQGKTIVYKIQSIQSESEQNKWMGAYGWVSEGFISAENKLFSFKNGLLYLHNQATTYNLIYGVQYKPRIMFVSNQEPLTPKVYDAIEIQANMKPTLTYFYNNDPYEQVTDLVDYDYRDLEGLFYSTIYRNKLIPTASGYSTNGLLTAEKIRGKTIFVMFEFVDGGEPLELEFVQLKYSLSKGHNKIQ